MRLDGISKRYGMLPSQVIQQADTLDLYIMDVAMTFENYYKKKANMKPGQTPLPDATTEELQEILYGNKT
jgi:hypothetical protein